MAVVRRRPATADNALEPIVEHRPITIRKGEPSDYGIVVASPHRRRGVGLRLLREAEAQCTSRKLFTSANASNEGAQALFRRAGFVRSGIIENLDPGDPEVIYFREAGK